jgi:hypothetical protein
MHRAKTTFWAPDNRLIREGDVLPDGDDVLDGREDLFDPVVNLQVDESRRRPRRSRTAAKDTPESEKPARNETTEGKPK